MSSTGYYESKSYLIPNTPNEYVALISIQKTNPHQEYFRTYYATSTDDINWSIWKPLIEGSMIIAPSDNINGQYFKYKVQMSTTDYTKRPYLQEVKIFFAPYFLIENLGDLDTKPKLWIRKTEGDGDIRIINQKTDQIVEIKNLKDNEEVYMNCEYEELISSLQENYGVYRFDDHNDEWLVLTPSDNVLRTEGDFDLDIRYQGRLLQE